MRRTLLLVAVICIAAVFTAHSVCAQEREFSEWIKVLEPHLRPAYREEGDTEAPFDWRRDSQFLVQLNGEGEPANAYFIPGGAALVAAARAYALLTGDFAVSLGELEQSGWWPYATIPADMDRSALVIKTDGGRVLDKYHHLKSIGSANWIAEAKREVLREFYGDFFYRPLNDEDKAAGMPKTSRTPADLPSRRAEFWINPYTGTPMRVSEEPGDLRLEDVSFFKQGSLVSFRRDGTIASHHGSSGSVGRDKSNPVEVAMLNWQWEKPQPWSARAGQDLPVLPVWLRSGAESASAQAHLDALLTQMAPLDKHGATTGIIMDASGERAPLEELACPQALALAAHYYAIETADMQVSLRDIIDAGFWPYDTFPTWLDLSETLYEFPREEQAQLGFTTRSNKAWVADYDHWTGYLAQGLGTPEWLLWRKAEILNQVHTELFFKPHPEWIPAQGVDVESGEVLPRFAAFWVNPLATAAAGKPVAFSFGPALGQLSRLDVNLLRPVFEGARIRYVQDVPLINLADKLQYAAGGEPKFVYRQRSVRGITELAQSWQLPSALGGTVAELRWRYAAPTRLQEQTLLDVGWDPPRQELGLDGKPVPPERVPFVSQYARGAELRDCHTHGDWGERQPVQIVHDGVAPLMQRYHVSFSDQPRDYTFNVQMLRIRSNFTSLRGGRAGIDELAPAPQVQELATVSGAAGE
jgi:hypothetical protein